MYYKVTMFKKDENVKEIILKAENKEDIEVQLPQIKAFLFPNADVDKCKQVISNVPVECSYGRVINQYRITIYAPAYFAQLHTDSEDFNFDNISGIFKADSPEDAKQQALAHNETGLIGEMSADDWDVFVDEMTVEQCIEEQMVDLKRQFIRKYLNRHFNYEKLPIRQAIALERENNDNLDFYYEVLCDLNKEYRIIQALKRNKNIGKLTVAEYNDILERMMSAISESEYNSAIIKAKELSCSKADS